MQGQRKAGDLNDQWNVAEISLAFHETIIMSFITIKSPSYTADKIHIFTASFIRFRMIMIIMIMVILIIKWL